MIIHRLWDVARHPVPNLMEVVQAVHLAPAALRLSQLQLQGLQAAGAQGAAEQLQEQRAGNHACQLVQQPLASCRGLEKGEEGENNNKNHSGQTPQRGSLL